VLLHQLGQHLVLGAELGLQGSNLAVLGIRAGLAAPAGLLEGGGAVLEENLLPVVEEGRLDAVLIAQVGDRDLLQEVAAQDGELLLGREVAALLAGHGGYLRGSIAANPPAVNFSFRLRQNSSPCVRGL
jgi:hypothetical protein